MMKFVAAVLSLTLVSPALAEDPKTSRGLELLGEGSRLLFEGLREDLTPQLRALADELRELEFDGFSVGDLSRYHAPEILPNGDIILRRKEPLQPPPEDGEIDI